MYKLSSLFSSRPSWLESFYEILAASTGQGGILMPDTIVMQYHKMSAAFASARDLSVQKTDLVRGGRVTTKVSALRCVAPLSASALRLTGTAASGWADGGAGAVRHRPRRHNAGVERTLRARGGQEP